MTGSLFELPCYGVSQQEVARKNLGAPDAVIYLNDVYEDGATPDAARKKRIDFTHTIKIKPKTRMMRTPEQPLYGEYNDKHFGGEKQEVRGERRYL